MIFMKKEDWDAITEQQTREINNLLVVRKSERERACNFIKERIRACEENKTLFPKEEEKYQEIICRFEELIKDINSQHVKSEEKESDLTNT